MFKIFGMLFAISFLSCSAFSVHATSTLEDNEQETSSKVSHKIKSFLTDEEGTLSKVEVITKKGAERSRVVLPAEFSFIGYHHNDDALKSMKVWGAKVIIGDEPITASMEVDEEAYTKISEKEKASDQLEQWSPITIKTIYKRPGEDQSELTIKKEAEFERYLKKDQIFVKRLKVCTGEFGRFTQGRTKQRHNITTYDIDAITFTEWRRPVGSKEVHENLNPYKKSDPIEIRRFVEQGEGPECGEIKEHGTQNTPNDVGVDFAKFLKHFQ